jgi:RNA polymerase sigma-70 factor (ECF subfamily)
MLESEFTHSNLSEVKSLPCSLDDFLSQVERRAYRTAVLSTRKPADALDIVQDAMTQLVQHYRARPAAEWPLLFQRILQHRIMDWHRQQTRHKKWFWQTASDVDDDGEDEINLIIDEREQDPAELLARASDIQCVIKALEQLPLRQRQAFMLRAWEGFDVQETAESMGCSEGSVKTHYFRALQTLREHLRNNA